MNKAIGFCLGVFLKKIFLSFSYKNSLGKKAPKKKKKTKPYQTKRQYLKKN